MSTENKTKLSITFKLLKVSDVLLNIESLRNNGIDKIDESKLSVTIDFDIKPEHEKNVIALSFVVQYVYLKDINPIGILLYQNKFEFEIKNFEDTFIDGNINSMVAINFIGVAISTTRGILIEKVANTELRGLILPILNPVDLYHKKYFPQE